jgi:hypothetical protein
VLVVPLACLIVVAEHTIAIYHKGKAILEAVAASGKGRWKAPHHNFDENVFREDMALVEQ